MTNHDTAVVRTSDGRWNYHRCIHGTFKTRAEARSHWRDQHKGLVVSLDSMAAANDMTPNELLSILTGRKQSLACRLNLHRHSAGRKGCTR